VGPDYYLHETSAELVFPHRLTAMSAEEIRSVDAEMYEILFS
jgi:hypothetical protein